MSVYFEKIIFSNSFGQMSKTFFSEYSGDIFKCHIFLYIYNKTYI